MELSCPALSSLDLLTPHPVWGDEGEPEDRYDAAGEREEAVFRDKTQKGQEQSRESIGRRRCRMGV